MKLAGSGHVCLWPGGSLFIGRSTDVPTDVHAHHAIQLTLGLSGPARLRCGDGEWVEGTGFVVASNRPHAFVGGGHQVAHIFVEPETPEGRALQAIHRCPDGIERLPRARAEAAAAALRRRYAQTNAREALVATARELVRELTAGGPERAVVDPRVSRALEVIRAQLDGSTTLAEVARAAHLSPSRFRHVFVAETGMTFRGYVLWQRLLRAFEVAADGRSWTHAAHAAGFADSAHLTRTCRRMFGIAPAMIRTEPQA